MEREAEKLVSEMKCEEDSPAITRFDSGKRATVCGGLYKTENVGNILPEPPEAMCPCQHLEFSSVRPISDL